MTTKLDVKAIRALAEHARCGAITRDEWAKTAMSDVPALCDRVGELKAEHDALIGAVRAVGVSVEPRDGGGWAVTNTRAVAAETISILDAALAQPTDNTALREFGVRCAKNYAATRSVLSAEQVVDAVLRGER